MTARYTRFVGTAGVVTLVTLAAFTRTSIAAPHAVRVRIADLSFMPNVIHVQPGQPIVWTNEDQVSHTVTSGMSADDALWRSSEPIGQGETFSLTLAKPGVYPYFCKPHFYNPAMHATIVVDPAKPAAGKR